MNAIEIAEEFETLLKEREEHPWGNFEILYDVAATMLRQQHDRLCLLENIVMDLKATLRKAQE